MTGRCDDHPVRAVLLDFYGTVVHEDDKIVAEICAEVADHAQVATTAKQVGRIWSDIFFTQCRISRGDTFLPQRTISARSLQETVNQTGSDVDPVPLSTRQFAQWKEPEIFPDARDFLEEVKGLGIPVCVLSNIDRADIMYAMSHHSIHVDHLITSDDVRGYKPNPELFEAGLNKLGLRAEEVLHVGDSRTSDVAGAITMGIPVAWLNRTNKPVPVDDPPDWTVNALERVLPLLRQ